ncbi:MAG: porin [Thiotrichales bacterium]
MKKKLIVLAVTASSAAPAVVLAEIETKWFGFTQITAQQHDANGSGNLVFGADRARIGFKLKDKKNPVYGGVQIDFNRGDISAKREGTLPEIIKDAYGGYVFKDYLYLKAGQFKSPIGMDFNISGKKLDITTRSMEKDLVLERAAGVMFSGHKISGGWGYDLFYGNAAGRSGAVAYNGGESGEANSYALRVKYDLARLIHVEAAYGVSEEAGGVNDPATQANENTEDYKVFDVAAAYNRGPLNVKAEYISGTNYKGMKDSNRAVFYVHSGYKVTSKVELVIRHYQGTYENTLTKADLSNTFLGATLFTGSNRFNGRLQINYVIAEGDIDILKENFGFRDRRASQGFLENALLAQYQISF